MGHGIVHAGARLQRDVEEEEAAEEADEQHAAAQYGICVLPPVETDVYADGASMHDGTSALRSSRGKHMVAAAAVLQDALFGNAQPTSQRPAVSGVVAMKQPPSQPTSHALGLRCAHLASRCTARGRDAQMASQ